MKWIVIAGAGSRARSLLLSKTSRATHNINVQDAVGFGCSVKIVDMTTIKTDGIRVGPWNRLPGRKLLMIQNERSIRCGCGANVIQGIVVFKYPSGAYKRFLDRFDLMAESKSVDPSSGEEGLNTTLQPHRCDMWKDLVVCKLEVMTVEIAPEGEGH